MGGRATVVVSVVSLLLSLLVLVQPAGAAVVSSAKPYHLSLLPSAKVHRAAVHAPAAGGATAGPAAPAPQPISEITQDRTATSSTWRNTNGSVTVRQYAEPHFYQSAGSTSWQQIDSRLVPVSGEAGWWRSAGNSWTASFGRVGAPGGGVQIAVGGKQIGFSAGEAANPDLAPTVSGSEATYGGLWPRCRRPRTVLPTGVKEDIVLRQASDRSSFEFTLSGAVSQLNSSGGIDLLAGGVRVGTVPGPSVATSGGADATKASAARWTVEGSVVRCR
jgi:hypothetical protein